MHQLAASNRGRTSVYHWLHELPSSTLVATCWWWSLEPHRRQRYSSRRGTPRRRARASWQTPKSVSAGCTVVNADGESRSRWRWKHAPRGWGQPKKITPSTLTCWFSAMIAPPSCRDGKLPSPIEGAPRTSPKQLGLVHVEFQPISWHPVVNVHDALLKSSDGRRRVIATTVRHLQMSILLHSAPWLCPLGLRNIK